MKNVFPLAGMVVLWCAPLLRAADYQGADVALKKMAEQRKKVPDAAKPADPVEELRKKVADFRSEAPTLPPEQAATRWLALFDVFAALPAEALNNSADYGNYNDRSSARSFLQALPP